MTRVKTFAAVLSLTFILSTAARAQSDGKPLFDGKSLDGWEHVGPGRFVVEDGQMRTEGGMGLLWYSREKLSDPWYAVHHGFEVQIADTGQAARRTGSIYTFAEAKSQPGKPLEWNTL